jgi:uncharacterized membrane protein YhaH (DUF805 family)
MNFIESFRLVYFKELFTVNSRSSRWEYWGAELLYILFYIVIYIIFIFFSFDSIPLLDTYMAIWSTISFTTVSIRRMHDVGKSGWVLLWYLTVIGALYILVLTLTSSEQHENKWGSPRKHTIQSEQEEE